MAAVRPTWRGAALATAGLALTALGLLGGGWPYTLLAGVYALLLLALARAEVEGLAGLLSSLPVEREAPSTRVVDGVRVPVRVVVGNPTSRHLRVEVYERPSPRLAYHGPLEFEAVIPPGGEAVFEYAVVPAPGRHRLPPLVLRLSDPLGLWLVEGERGAELVLYAAPSPVDAGGAWRWERPGLGAAPSRLLRGRGLEFYEIREYQPGDDPRRIVWTATARTGRLMVREDLVETPASIVVFADLSAESWIGPRGRTPGDYIARATVALARLAASTGGRFGYTVFLGVSHSIMPPTRPSEALPHLVSLLSSVDPEEASGRAAFHAALRRGLTLPGWGVRVVLLGPGGLREAEVSALLRVRRRLGYPMIVALLLPPGGGPLERLVRIVERERAREAAKRLEAEGVRVFVGEADKVGVVLEYAAREALRWPA